MQLTPHFKQLLISLGLLFFLLSSSVAHARTGFKFGDSETLHKVTDISMKGPKGESLYLAKRTITKFFFLGLYLSDKGYVLAVSDDKAKGYYPLGNDLIKKLQDQGALPKPLPQYNLTWWDYLIAYSLWIVLFIIISWTIFQYWKLSKEP